MPSGRDGLEVELRSDGSYIQWRYKGYRQWNNIISVKELIGPRGQTGQIGSRGEAGPKGASGEKGDRGEKGEKGDRGLQGYAGGPGQRGPQGFTGATGPSGPGVASGGTAGQVLKKASGDDYDTEWGNPPSSTNGFTLQDPGYDKTSTYVYVGYAHTDGRWYIYRRTISNNAREYASGTSDYSTNWTGRSGLSYS